MAIPKERRFRRISAEAPLENKKAPFTQQKNHCIKETKKFSAVPLCLALPRPPYAVLFPHSRPITGAPVRIYSAKQALPFGRRLRDELSTALHIVLQQPTTLLDAGTVIFPFTAFNFKYKLLYHAKILSSRGSFQKCIFCYSG